MLVTLMLFEGRALQTPHAPPPSLQDLFSLPEALPLEPLTLERLVGPHNVSLLQRKKSVSPSALLSMDFGNLSCPSGDKHPLRLLSCSVERLKCSAVVGEKPGGWFHYPSNVMK